jgi:hypothetical protein
VIYLPRTKGISTTKIKYDLNHVRIRQRPWGSFIELCWCDMQPI